MTVRKNFLFDEDVALKANASQTQVVKDLIEEKYDEYSVQDKLDAIERLTGCMNGLIGNDVSIQSIKMEMGSNI